MPMFIVRWDNTCKVVCEGWMAWCCGGIFGGGGGGIFGRERPVRHLSMFHSLPRWGVNLHTYIITVTIIITLINTIRMIFDKKCCLQASQAGEGRWVVAWSCSPSTTGCKSPKPSKPSSLPSFIVPNSFITIITPVFTLSSLTNLQ